MSLSKTEFKEILEQSISQLAEGFQGIEYLLRNSDMSERERREYLSPETLGPVSAFLQCGNGYEAAFSNGKTIEDLQAYADEMDDEEEEEDDEDEEGDDSFEDEIMGACATIATAEEVSQTGGYASQIFEAIDTIRAKSKLN